MSSLLLFLVATKCWLGPLRPCMGSMQQRPSLPWHALQPSSGSLWLPGGSAWACYSLALECQTLAGPFGTGLTCPKVAIILQHLLLHLLLLLFLSSLRLMGCLPHLLDRGAKVLDGLEEGVELASGVQALALLDVGEELAPIALPQAALPLALLQISRLKSSHTTLWMLWCLLNTRSDMHV